ncbi:MAG TPA: heme o synthase [Longimicrobiales bacterium]
MDSPTTQPSRLHDFLELTKPGITRMVALTTAAGFALVPGPFQLVRFIHALIGTALVAAGAGALNQHFERGVDARMARTRERPLAAGRVEPASALAFGLTLGVIGTAYLAYFTTTAAALLALASLASYWLVYTPLKPRTSISTIIGGIPGALPILIGWAATGEPLGPAAWTLFGIMFLWQIPHFLALAFIYREDYRRGGLAMLSVDDTDGESTSRQAVVYALALIPVSLLPPAYGLGGLGYFACALALGIAFLVLALRLQRERDLRSARRLFFGSLLYLPGVLTALVVDRWI